MNKVSTISKDKNKDENIDIERNKELSELEKIQYIRCPVKAIIINNNLFKGGW